MPTELDPRPGAALGGMDVLDAIRTRRSVAKIRPERPPRELIAEIVEAATWAPNHRLTEPWRFVVLAGDARRQLGDVMARSQAERKLAPVADADADTTFARTAAKPLRAPVVIVVAIEPVVAPKVVEIEEVAAGAAAVQNMLLAAHALGLAAIWRTGDAAYDAAVKTHFGLSPAAHLLDFVYVGYPAGPPPARTRRPATDVTRWLDWDDDER